mmetsp:Transcript_19897/g.32734  ORF Transcript_19897/g.32734 Transcript_19897/m.32734 type:complete len:530 (-) Transcript_19897:1919-3508(-)
MMRSIKVKKRRAVQKSLQGMGKAEVTTEDAEFNLAVARFHRFEKQLQGILSKLKDSRKYLEKQALVNSVLAERLAEAFADDALIDMEEHVSKKAVGTYSVLAERVAPSCKFVLHSKAIEQVEELLRTLFPSRKKLLVVHEGLRTDLDSYRRRVKKLQDKGKEGNDAQLLKLTTKLESTRHEYETKHQQLLTDLNQMHANRPNYLDPVFAAFVSSEVEYHGYLSQELNHITSSLTNEHGQACRNQIQDYIVHGEIPQPKKSPSQNRLLFSKLQSKLSSKRDLTASKHTSLDSPTGSATASGGMAAVPPPSPPTSSPPTPPLEEDRHMTQQEPYAEVAEHRHEDGVSPAYSDFASQESSPMSPAHRNEASAPVVLTSPGFGYGEAHHLPLDSETPGDDSYYGGGAESPAPKEDEVVKKSVPVALSPSSFDDDDDDVLPHPQHQEPARDSKTTRALEAHSDDGDYDDDYLDEVEEAEEMCVATFPFEGTDEDDLSFKKGDVMVVIEKIDSGWWRAELNGRIGLIPTTYVRPK